MDNLTFFPVEAFLYHTNVWKLLYCIFTILEPLLQPSRLELGLVMFFCFCFFNFVFENHSIFCIVSSENC